MELRVLRYFLAVAREGNITGAANSLHLSQASRNNPSTEVILKLHKRYNDINLEWLLTGKGNMSNNSPVSYTHLDVYKRQVRYVPRSTEQSAATLQMQEAI